MSTVRDQEFWGVRLPRRRPIPQAWGDAQVAKLRSEGKAGPRATWVESRGGHEIIVTDPDRPGLKIIVETSGNVGMVS